MGEYGNHDERQTAKERVGVVEVEEEWGRRSRRFASSLWIFFFLQRLSHIVNIVVCSSFVCERDAARPAWPTLLSPSLFPSLSLAKLRLGLKWKQTATATNGIGIRSHEECSAHTHARAGRRAYACMYVCVCVSESFAWVDTKVRKNATQSLRHWQLCAQAHTHAYNCYRDTDVHVYVCMREWATVPSSLWFTHVEAGHWTCARALSTLDGARVQSAILLRTVAELTYIKVAK